MGTVHTVDLVGTLLGVPGANWVPNTGFRVMTDLLNY